MSEVNHTHGPWHHAGRRGGRDGVTAADGTDICHLEYDNPANATLAAPDMLAALKALVDRFDTLNGAPFINPHDSIWNIARRAVAKAEGREP